VSEINIYDKNLVNNIVVAIL